MHAHNSSVFLSAFISQSWIPAAAKARLVAWKGRHDLALYVSRRAPALRIDDIQSYTPKQPSAGNAWLNALDRAIRLEGDDGHAVKFVRACAHGEKLCAGWLKGKGVEGDMWIKIAQMCKFPRLFFFSWVGGMVADRRGIGIDSVEEPGAMWARSVGFDEAWEEYGPRKKY